MFFGPDYKPTVLMGANASGKTSLATYLASKTEAEIVSADSRQIYTHLQAGTSKPEGRWMEEAGEKNYYASGVRYHLVDFVDPRSSYSAGQYLCDANEKIEKIKKSGKPLIIAGGTGMYIQALFNGLDELPRADEKIRKELSAFAEENGRKALHEKLEKMDPLSASAIPFNNIHRVIRALEISILSGKPASQVFSGKFSKELPYPYARFIFIKWDKKTLHERIRKRTSACFENWVKETQNLIAGGYPYDCPGLKSLGYPAVIDYISGKLSVKDAQENIVTLSMEYAKRQNTWFSRYTNARLIELSGEEEFKPEKILESAGVLP